MAFFKDGTLYVDSSHELEMVIISDLHLGAKNCRTDAILDFFARVKTERLVIAGDLFDCPRVSGLEPAHLAVLARLRELSMRTEVIWLMGNHDPEPEFVSALLGLKVERELVVRLQNGRYLIKHGDSWDPSMQWPAWVIAGADWIYFAAQRLDRTHKLARRLKHGSKQFCQVMDILRTAAVKEARERGFAGVILGHSHVHCDEQIDGIHHLNSGCWTENPSTYIGIRDGVARGIVWDATPSESPVESTQDPVLTHVDVAVATDFRTPICAGEVK